MIKIRNLSKTFDNNKVLKNISFDVEKGDVIAILGPSGGGKTTLLKCLNFLKRADSGTMEFNGTEYDLRTISKSQIYNIRANTAFVFQNYNLFENKTVLENITIGLTVARRMNKNKANEIGIRMLEKVGLKDKMDSYPRQLSGGQQQRVAIARALACNPSVIYFDEPTSALDPELIGEVLGVIKELANEHMTMLIVTHEVNFARSVSNKILFLEDGSIIDFEDTEQFFKNQSNERINNFIQTVTRGEEK